MKTLIALLVVLLVWSAGLVAFADRVRKSTPAIEPPAADGVVALTGASDDRIAAGIRLLEEGKGRRLLVSGVNRKVKREEVQAAVGASDRVYECCVDLGFDAEDTLGNAQEIAAWAEARTYDHVIVVTSDYHMPRAILEIRGAAPRLELTPYPVVTPSLNAGRWWRSARGVTFMAWEYTKYLVVLAREAVLSIGDEKPAPAGKAAAAAG